MVLKGRPEKETCMKSVLDRVDRYCLGFPKVLGNMVQPRRQPASCPYSRQEAGHGKQHIHPLRDVVVVVVVKDRPEKETGIRSV